jgi:hypothetical protein
LNNPRSIASQLSGFGAAGAAGLSLLVFLGFLLSDFFDLWVFDGVVNDFRSSGSIPLLPVVGFPVVVDFSKSSGRTPLLPVVGLPEL